MCDGDGGADGAAPATAAPRTEKAPPPPKPTSARRLALMCVMVGAFFRVMMSSPEMYQDRDSYAAPYVPPGGNATEEKWLVVAMGNLRGGEDAWASLYSNVLVQDAGVADLALIVQDNFTTYPNASLLEWAKYTWTFPEYDDWADALDLVNGTGWRETHLPKWRAAAARSTWETILFGPLEGFQGSGMLIFMIRWFLVQHLLEEDIVSKYDRFVVTRNDHFYLCPHEFQKLDLRNDTVWIPAGEDWGGYTDRHLVVGRDNLLDALDIIPQLLMKPFTYNQEWHHNTERFVKHVWTSKKLNVKTFPRVMFTCGSKLDGGWKKATRPVGISGVFGKYREEFALATQTCREKLPKVT